MTLAAIPLSASIFFASEHSPTSDPVAISNTSGVFLLSSITYPPFKMSEMRGRPIPRADSARISPAD